MTGAMYPPQLASKHKRNTEAHYTLTSKPKIGKMRASRLAVSKWVSVHTLCGYVAQLVRAQHS
jgi:hypothetical protein